MKRLKIYEEYNIDLDKLFLDAIKLIFDDISNKYDDMYNVDYIFDNNVGHRFVGIQDKYEDAERYIVIVSVRMRKQELTFMDARQMPKSERLATDKINIYYEDEEVSEDLPNLLTDIRKVLSRYLKELDVEYDSYNEEDVIGVWYSKDGLTEDIINKIGDEYKINLETNKYNL